MHTYVFKRSCTDDSHNEPIVLRRSCLTSSQGVRQSYERIHSTHRFLQHSIAPTLLPHLLRAFGTQFGRAMSVHSTHRFLQSNERKQDYTEQRGA